MSDTEVASGITAAHIAEYANIIMFEGEEYGALVALIAARRAAERIIAAATPLIAAAAFPRCPTACDSDCEQPCHEAHQIPRRQDHNPETCAGTIVAAAVAAERARILADAREKSAMCYGCDVFRAFVEDLEGDSL